MRCFRLKRSNARVAHASTKEEICGKSRRKMEGSCYKSCDGSACGLHQHNTNNTHHTKRAANNKMQKNYQRIRCCQIRYGLRTLNYRLGSVLFGSARLGLAWLAFLPSCHRYSFQFFVLCFSISQWQIESVYFPHFRWQLTAKPKSKQRNRANEKKNRPRSLHVSIPFRLFVILNMPFLTQICEKTTHTQVKYTWNEHTL